MPSRKIAIAGFQHETNSFCPFGTTLADFECQDGWPALSKGNAILEIFPELNIPIGGFITAAGAWQLVPILWASAEPAGLIADQAFDTICAMVCDGLTAAGNLDGVYLDLHGAMVTETFEDGEAEILRRVREVVGEAMPVVCSLDFHANISRPLIDRASALAIFRHYPHTDMAETGARTARLLEHLLETGHPLHKSFKQIPYLIPLSSQGTTQYPFNELYAGFEQLEHQHVLSVDAAAGFPAADIYDCGPSVVAYGTSQPAADDASQKLYNRFMQAEISIPDNLLSPQDAIIQAADFLARDTRPVVLADVQDNPGAGGTCDTMHVLKALIGQDLAPAVVGIIFDPDNVEKAFKAGIGTEIELTIGNSHGLGGVPTFTHTFVVEQLNRDPVACTGAMYGGCDADLGPQALLRAKNTSHEISAVLASRRFQCLDLALLRHMGVVLEEPQIIVVKSTIHFLADFAPIAQQVLFVEAPGVHPCRLGLVDYKNLRPGVRRGPMGNSQPG